MKAFSDFITECYVNILISEGRGGKPEFNDEFANIKLYNHLVGAFNRKEGLGKKVRIAIHRREYDKVEDIVKKEIEAAKSNPNHPLHFANANDDGFSGGKKTPAHEEDYYNELQRATYGFNSFIRSRQGRATAAKGWPNVPQGGEHEESLPGWEGNPKGQGRVDYLYQDIQRPERQLRVSGKDVGGSVVQSSQGDQTFAGLVAGGRQAGIELMRNLLGSRPKKEKGETDEDYETRIAHLRAVARSERDKKIADVTDAASKIRDILNSSRGMTKAQQTELQPQIQSMVADFTQKHPRAAFHASQEAIRGTQQFGKGKDVQVVHTTGGEGSALKDPRATTVSLRARGGKGQLKVGGEKVEGKRPMALAGDTGEARTGDPNLPQQGPITPATAQRREKIAAASQDTDLQQRRAQLKKAAAQQAAPAPVAAQQTAPAPVAAPAPVEQQPSPEEIARQRAAASERERIANLPRRHQQTALRNSQVRQQTADQISQHMS